MNAEVLRGFMKLWLAQQYEEELDYYSMEAGEQYDPCECDRLWHRYKFLEEVVDKGERLPEDLWDEGEEDEEDEGDAGDDDLLADRRKYGLGVE